MPWGVGKRECTRARCSTSGSRNYADSKDNACDARHGARVVQIARCSEVRVRTAKSPFLSCFVSPVNFPFFSPKNSYEQELLSMQKSIITLLCTAQHSKIQLNFVKHFRIFTVSFSKFHSLNVSAIFVHISPILNIFSRNSSKFARKDQNILDSQIS